MHTISIKLSWVIALLLFLNLGVANGGDRGHGNAVHVSPQELLAQLDSDKPPLVLDVRTAKEYAAGHVPGAMNIPHTEVADRIDELDAMPDNQLVVYCEKGGRAHKAQNTLERAGFTHVVHMNGDMQAWRDNDLPMER
jgi:rhodanese-related sulfurtransferase